MKLIIPTLCCLLLVPLSPAEEAPDMKQVLADASLAVKRMEVIRREMDKIQAKQPHPGDGDIGLNEEDKRLMRDLLTARSNCLDSMKRAADLLKVGNSLFSYPGLLALGPVKYDAAKEVYQLNLVINYRGYEGGPERHPTIRVVSFDKTGTITKLEEIDTVKMVTY